MDYGDLTALHHAVTQGRASLQRLDIIRTLIRGGADVDRRTRRGLTQHESDKRWQTAVTLDALIDSLLSGDMGFVGIGFAPLDLTAMLDDWEATALLIHAGADVNATGHEGETTLHLAVLYGADKTARLLVEAGADVSARTKRQETPLTWASRRLAAWGLCGEYKARVDPAIAAQGLRSDCDMHQAALGGTCARGGAAAGAAEQRVRQGRSGVGTGDTFTRAQRRSSGRSPGRRVS